MRFVYISGTFRIFHIEKVQRGNVSSIEVEIVSRLEYKHFRVLDGCVIA